MNNTYVKMSGSLSSFHVADTSADAKLHWHASSANAAAAANVVTFIM